MNRQVATKNGQLDPAVLDDIVREVVAAAQPDRIILFGSAARGEMGPDSDVDLLVVKEGAERWPLTKAIRAGLRRFPMPFDVVISTPEEVERLRSRKWSVFEPALREGRVLYAR